MKNQETKKLKKLVLKKSVIQKLNDDEMNDMRGGTWTPVGTFYSPCQWTPTAACR
ncbi:MAG: TIGR04149 family rSAM-modified RiPP [Tannerellaceae bacterium]|nr:TIGR04149 family rSAM-modified RiPP [Tannerellaceae bacterium]